MQYGFLAFLAHEQGDTQSVSVRPEQADFFLGERLEALELSGLLDVFFGVFGELELLDPATQSEYGSKFNEVAPGDGLLRTKYVFAPFCFFTKISPSNENELSLRSKASFCLLANAVSFFLMDAGVPAGSSTMDDVVDLARVDLVGAGVNFIRSGGGLPGDFRVSADRLSISATLASLMQPGGHAFLGVCVFVSRRVMALSTVSDVEDYLKAS